MAEVRIVLVAAGTEVGKEFIVQHGPSSQIGHLGEILRTSPPQAYHGCGELKRVVEWYSGRSGEPRRRRRRSGKTPKVWLVSSPENFIVPFNVAWAGSIFSLFLSPFIP